MEKIQFSNNSEPYLSADNLNQMQSNIENAIGGVYSIEETFTGKYWIDGKKIYRKVMNLGALPNAEQKQYTWNIENINEVVDFKIYAIDTSNNSQLTLPYVYPSTSYLHYWITVEYLNTTSVVIVTGIDRSKLNLRVILEYTKTTD